MRTRLVRLSVLANSSGTGTGWTTTESTAATPHEVAQRVRQMVEGEQVDFAAMFAADGVLEYPFSAPGMPERLDGREEIRAFVDALADEVPSSLFEIEHIESVVHQTSDPEVVVTEITHRGTSNVTGAPYRSSAIGVIRVRDGLIVSYRDYMNPLTVAEISGRTEQLVRALGNR